MPIATPFETALHANVCEAMLFERERPKADALIMPGVLSETAPFSLEVYQMLHYHYFVKSSSWKLGSEQPRAFLD